MRAELSRGFPSSLLLLLLLLILKYFVKVVSIKYKKLDVDFIGRCVKCELPVEGIKALLLIEIRCFFHSQSVALELKLVYWRGSNKETYS